jgi:hypothetical protein
MSGPQARVTVLDIKGDLDDLRAVPGISYHRAPAAMTGAPQDLMLSSGPLPQDRWEPDAGKTGAPAGEGPPLPYEGTARPAPGIGAFGGC